MIRILEEKVTGSYERTVRPVLVRGDAIGEVFLKGLIFDLDLKDKEEKTR